MPSPGTAEPPAPVPDAPSDRLAGIARIVDIFLQDRLVASYTVSWRLLDAPISDGEFVALAKARLRDDGYTRKAIAAARFSLRAPSPSSPPVRPSPAPWISGLY